MVGGGGWSIGPTCEGEVEGEEEVQRVDLGGMPLSMLGLPKLCCCGFENFATNLAVSGDQWVTLLL